MSRARVATLLMALAACETDHHVVACTLVGCLSGADFTLAPIAEADLGRLTGARIDVCYPGTCKHRVIDALPAPNEIEGMFLGSPGEPRVEVTLARTHPSGALEIRVEIGSEDHERFQDGDIYTVSIVAADGSVVVDRRWSVTYRTTQPNGPDCEPTCRFAVTATDL